jgi:hypothetical protein
MADYCSYSPDYIFGVYVGLACQLHDIDYQTHRVSRLRADWDLFINMCRIRWWLAPIALIYFLMVRCFGWIAWKQHN